MALPDGARPGTPVDQVLPLKDWALEIGLTPNRPDCASVIGVAREVAAIRRGTVEPPDQIMRYNGKPVIVFAFQDSLGLSTADWLATVS